LNRLIDPYNGPRKILDMGLLLEKLRHNAEEAGEEPDFSMYNEKYLVFLS